jgi:hypothetical protein
MLDSYKVGELVTINGVIEDLSNKIGIVTRETMLTKRTNMAITWVCILEDDCESPFLNNALSRLDT